MEYQKEEIQKIGRREVMGKKKIEDHNNQNKFSTCMKSSMNKSIVL